MRTDTKTFEKRAFAMTRALGINSVRSKQVAARIVSGMRHGAYFMGGGQWGPVAEFSTIELELAIRGAFQSVMVTVDGEFAFSASTTDNVLVSLEPTPEQQALAQPIHEAMIALYGAEDADRPAAQAAYDALRDRSLALNPFAPANVVDPMLFECHSEVVEYRDGYKPGGHRTVDECRRYLLRVREDQDREAA